MYIDSSDSMMEMLAAYHADKAAAATTEAPAAPAAPITLKNPGEVKPREFPTCPNTTYEQCERYGASPYKCGCPDRAARNGSYTGLDGRPACKHMIFKQKYYTDIAI